MKYNDDLHACEIKSKNKILINLYSIPNYNSFI